MALPDHLLHQSYISLATQRKNGDLVPTPIWAAEVDGNLYAFSESKAGKMKRLRNFSQVEIAACTSNGKLLGVWHPAQAFQVTDPQDISRAYDALLTKYGWRMKILDLGSRLAGKYNKRAIIRIEPR